MNGLNGMSLMFIVWLSTHTHIKQALRQGLGSCSVGYSVYGVQKALIISTYPKVRKGSKITHILFFIFLFNDLLKIFEPTFKR